MRWKIKQATKLLTSGNCVLFCCLIPFLIFRFLSSSSFFSKHFALKVRWGKKCRRREKIGKLETNFKNFALTGRKKAQQTNYRKLIVGMGERRRRRRRGIDGQSDWMTERLTDNWTSVASQGEEGKTGVASFFGGAMSKQMLQLAGRREREAAVLFYVAAGATPTPACLQLWFVFVVVVALLFLFLLLL